MNKATEKLKSAIEAWPLDDEQRDLLLPGIGQIEQRTAELLAEKLTQTLEQSRETVNDIRATKLVSEFVRLTAATQPEPVSAEERELIVQWAGGSTRNVVRVDRREIALQLADFAKLAESRDVQLARRLEQLEDIDRHILRRSEAWEIVASRIEGIAVESERTRRVAWRSNKSGRILASLSLVFIGAMFGPLLWSFLSSATKLLLSLLR